MTDHLMVPPHSNEAEQSVLGGLMLADEAWDAVCDVVRSDDFYSLAHRKLFAAIHALAVAGKPRDALTVSEALGPDLDEARGLSYLAELVKNTAGVANIAHYARIVADRAVHRRVLRAHMEAGTDLWGNPENLQESVHRAVNRMVDAVDDGRTEVPLIRECGMEWVEHLERVYSSGSEMVGMPTGFTDLDRALLGMPDGEVIVIAARPSMGKSAFALQIAMNRAVAGDGVYIASMEMPRLAVMNRLAACSTGMKYEDIRAARMDIIGPSLGVFTGRFREWNMAIDCDPMLDLNRLESRCRAHKRKHGLRLVVVDYLQLMRWEGNNENEGLSKLSRGMKILAGVLGCPVLLLSQLNRELEKRADKRPQMSDIRGSGAIEQDAHTILFLYRDVVYNPNTPHPEYTEVIIGKARDADRNVMVPLYTDLSRMRFGNVDWSSFPQDFGGRK